MAKHHIEPASLQMVTLFAKLRVTVAGPMLLRHGPSRSTARQLGHMGRAQADGLPSVDNRKVIYHGGRPGRTALPG